MSGSHRAVRAGLEPTCMKVSVATVIQFLWNATAGKSAGEKISFSTAEFTKQLPGV